VSRCSVIIARRHVGRSVGSVDSEHIEHRLDSDARLEFIWGKVDSGADGGFAGVYVDVALGGAGHGER